MKKSLFISPLTLLSVLFVAFMISCSGDDGADGAAGADGATGAQGPAGPEGPAGPKGDDGSGTIIYSEWMDVAFKPDTMHTAGGDIDTIGYYTTVNAPKLTKEMLSTADVKMYINSNVASDPVIYSLPYSDRSGLYIQTTIYTENIDLYSNADISTFVNRDGNKFYQYRYMIIPGNISATSRSTVDWSDYTQAKTYVGLKD